MLAVTSDGTRTTVGLFQKELTTLVSKERAILIAF